MLKNEQKSAKTLPQRLAGLNKGRGAWGENLACGVAWQSVLLGRSGAWQGALNSAKCNTAWRSEFDNETAQRGTTNSTNSATQHSKHSEFSMASTTRQIQCEENGAVLAGEAGKAKMEQCLSGISLSLSLSLLALFGTPLG